jgi:hypothetical protein
MGTALCGWVGGWVGLLSMEDEEEGWVGSTDGRGLSVCVCVYG